MHGTSNPRSRATFSACSRRKPGVRAPCRWRRPCRPSCPASRKAEARRAYADIAGMCSQAPETAKELRCGQPAERGACPSRGRFRGTVAAEYGARGHAELAGTVDPNQLRFHGIPAAGCSPQIRDHFLDTKTRFARTGELADRFHSERSCRHAASGAASPDMMIADARADDAEVAPRASRSLFRPSASFHFCISSIFHRERPAGFVAQNHHRAGMSRTNSSRALKFFRRNEDGLGMVQRVVMRRMTGCGSVRSSETQGRHIVGFLEFEGRTSGTRKTSLIGAHPLVL